MNTKKNQKQIAVASKRGGFSPIGYRRIDVTSHARDIFRQCSPFILGPIPLYDGHVSKTMENAWQYAKLYRRFADSNGDPTAEYFQWAQAGWSDPVAHRHPMGSFTPLCTIWKGKKLSYTEARREVYVPLYSAAVAKTEGYQELQRLCAAGDRLCLLDFDGYDPDDLGYSFQDVLNDTTRTLGHALILKAMLEGTLQL